MTKILEQFEKAHKLDAIDKMDILRDADVVDLLQQEIFSNSTKRIDKAERVINYLFKLYQKETNKNNSTNNAEKKLTSIFAQIN